MGKAGGLKVYRATIAKRSMAQRCGRDNARRGAPEWRIPVDDAFRKKERQPVAEAPRPARSFASAIVCVDGSYSDSTAASIAMLGVSLSR